MSHKETIRYGSKSEFGIEFSDAGQVQHLGKPMGEGFDDPVAAVLAALVTPLDFPALADATVPGDRVVIAVGDLVPEVNSVLDGVLQTLVDGGVSAENITVLVASSDPHGMERVHVEQWRDPVEVLRHDPCDRMSLAYLATTENGQPVYMNRHICDADLVITIGCIRPAAAKGYFGVHGSVYPAFADIDTVRRFHSRQTAHAEAESEPSSDGASENDNDLQDDRGLTREVDEAGWLLGARFTIQIIPGGGGEILHILSGDVDVVNSEGARLSRRAWACQVSRRSKLVVAALDGDDSQQTWQNLYRAIEAASHVVSEGGAVVLCTELERPLDELSLRAIAGGTGLDESPLTDSSPDAASAGRSEEGGSEEGGSGENESSAIGVPPLSAIRPGSLIPVLEDVSIYLLSALEDQLVENLGMVPIAKTSEISNLCRQFEDCLVISNAQHAWPEVCDAAVSST